MKSYSQLLVLLLLIIVFTASSMAGIVIKGVEKLDQKENTPSKVYIDTDKIRIESSDEGKSMIIIFRNDKDVMWMINENEKSYMEMTKEDVAKMKEQIDAAMAQMQEQLKNLPPEQREMMMKMMPGKMTEQAKPKVVYQKKASGIKLNKWNCTHYIGMLENEKKNEVWTIDLSQAGVNETDMRGMRSMSEFFEALSGEIDEFYTLGSEEFEKEGGYSGIPVKFVSYSENRVISDFEITEIKKQNLDAALFELPPGLNKKKQPFGKMD